MSVCVLVYLEYQIFMTNILLVYKNYTIFMRCQVQSVFVSVCLQSELGLGH